MAANAHILDIPIVRLKDWKHNLVIVMPKQSNKKLADFDIDAYFSELKEKFLVHLEECRIVLYEAQNKKDGGILTKWSLDLRDLGNSPATYDKVYTERVKEIGCLPFEVILTEEQSKSFGFLAEKPWFWRGISVVHEPTLERYDDV